MTQAVNPTRMTMPAPGPGSEVLDPLRQGLSDLGRSRRMHAWAAAALRGLAAWLALVLAAVILDAAWPLPAAGRWALLGLLLVMGPVLVLMRRRRSKAGEDRELLGDARTLERADRDRANALVNGVQVGPMRHEAGDAFAAALAQRAHRRGLRRFEKADRDAVIDRRTLARQAGNLYAAAAAWLIVLLIHPALVGGGLARLSLPWADHPPFSLTELDVMIEPAQPTVGDDVRVTATTAGKLAEEAALVQLDADDRAQRRWPMSALPQSRGAFAHTFVEVREPIRFRVEAGDARCRVLTITPRPADAAAAAPDPSANTDEPPTDAAEAPAAAPAEAGGGSIASMLPAIYERLNGLIDRAAELQARAAPLADGPESEAQRQAWRDALAALDADLDQFQEDAAVLADDVREEATRQDEPVRGQLQRLAEAIESLGLCRTGACPLPAAAGSPEPKAEAARGSGAGTGAGGNALGPAGQWAAGVRDAGRGAVTTLRAMRQRLDQVLATGGRLDPDAEAHTPAAPEPEVATGTATQAQDTADPARRLRDAILEKAPSAYRELTARYFDRLATETD